MLGIKYNSPNVAKDRGASLACPAKNQRGHQHARRQQVPSDNSSVSHGILSPEESPLPADQKIELRDSTTVSRYRAAAHLEQHPQTASVFTFESGEEGWRPTRNTAPAQANARLGEIFVKITKAGAGWRAWPFRMRKRS